VSRREGGKKEYRGYANPHKYSNLQCAFPGSIWVACSINMGPRSVLDDHMDVGNAPGVPCAITALGKFDPTKGRHLVLFDLKLIIQFPPSSTILIPSASLRHGNIRVQDSETRYSVFQYMADGLSRHLAWASRFERSSQRRPAGRMLPWALCGGSRCWLGSPLLSRWRRIVLRPAFSKVCLCLWAGTLIRYI
jgi:hypothetical protein